MNEVRTVCLSPAESLKVQWGEEAGESHHTYKRGAGCLAEPCLMLTHSWSVETEGDTVAEFFSSFEFQFN